MMKCLELYYSNSSFFAENEIRRSFALLLHWRGCSGESCVTLGRPCVPSGLLGWAVEAEKRGGCAELSLRVHEAGRAVGALNQEEENFG